MEEFKGCLWSGGMFALGIIGLIFIKEILIVWWVFLALAVVLAIIMAISGK